MNSFAGGFLIGFACGLWFAILLYWLWGKRAALLAASGAVDLEPEPQPAPPRQADAHEPPLDEPDEPDEQAGPAEATEVASPVTKIDPGASRYTRLVKMVGGDVAAAERLIDYERTRAPDAARSIWIQNAIDRLIHDRR
jgi:hypothetical protein